MADGAAGRDVAVVGPAVADVADGDDDDDDVARQVCSSSLHA